MDEHNSLPPQSPITQIDTTTTTNNNVHSIAQPFTPSLQYQQSLLQNSQFSLDTNNIDWVSILSGGSFTNGGGNQMPPSSVPLTSRISSTNNVGGGKDENSWKNKRKGGRTKKSAPPRIAFHTRSSEDLLDDGFKWRKYGQKAVKNSKHPRSYYRCTHHTCNVKKQIQRLSRDNAVVVTTYEGNHNLPCEKLMETLSPLLKQLQFLSRF